MEFSTVTSAAGNPDISCAALIGPMPKNLAMPCPLGRPRARPRRRFRVARIAISPVNPGSVSRPLAMKLSIFRALLGVGPS